MSGGGILDVAKSTVATYTIGAALDRGIFAAVHVSTGPLCYGDVARYYGAGLPCLHPPTIAREFPSFIISRVERVLRKLADVVQSRV